MPFEIVRNDIVNMRVDAIVNTANPWPVIGSGTDAAIHAKAGPLLLMARRRIGEIPTGEARITRGFRLPAKYVIHTVGPVWEDGLHEEPQLLRRCYQNSLELARRKGLRSIAFPLISTGNYGFPSALALEIATQTIREFLEKVDMDVYLVVFSRESFRLSGQLQREIRSFIDERYVREQTAKEYSFSLSHEFEPVEERMRNLRTVEYEDAVFGAEPWEEESEDGMPMSREPERPVCPGASAPLEPLCPPASRQEREPAVRKSAVRPKKAETLEQMLKTLDAGFSETLLKLIDQTGKKDAEVYRRANVSRQHFSKIRNNPRYQPTKSTALAFAIALELDLAQTKDLIGRAGFALTTSSKADLIIMYFIEKKHYNIIDINTALFEFDQSLLGA